MISNKNIALLVALVLIVGAIVYLDHGKVAPSAYSGPTPDVALPAGVGTTTEDMAAATTTMAMAASATSSVATAKAPAAPAVPTTAERVAQKSLLYPRAKELVDPTGFVNTGGLPITLSQYVGKKVVVFDIMTYSCINCIRTFPYLVSWYKKYEDKGLVIIGIQTPEFDFEKHIDNVTAAMQKYGITFPVVLDNNYGTWTAYNNLYWPHKYLIDIDGFVRYDHIGEGGYTETEQEIQQLLDERADVLGLGSALKASIDDTPLTTGVTETGQIGESLETYFGSERNEYFGNPTAKVQPGANGTDTFTVPAASSLATSQFYLGGTWDIETDHAENVSAPATIVYPFAAKHVYLVASADAPVPVEVSIDGVVTGTVTVEQSRLYDIYDGAAFGRHTLVLTPQTKGLKAFTLTFGAN